MDFPSKPTYTQAHDAYQFFMEFCRQHPGDEQAYQAFLHSEQLLNALWHERQQSL